MVIGSGRRDVVSGFLRKYGSERGVFQEEHGFWFGFLSCGGKFSGSGEFGDDQRSCWDKVRSTSDDLVDSAVLSGTDNVFIFCFPIIVCKEVLVNDSVDVGVMQGFDRGSDEMGFVSFSVNKEGAEEFLRLVEGFFDGEGSFNTVDRGIDFFQPRES